MGDGINLTVDPENYESGEDDGVMNQPYNSLKDDDSDMESEESVKISSATKRLHQQQKSELKELFHEFLCETLGKEEVACDDNAKQLIAGLLQRRESGHNEEGKEGKERGKTVVPKKSGNVDMVKSPSDTTTYAPALNKRNNDGEQFGKGHVVAGKVIANELDQVTIANQISNFVEAVRLNELVQESVDGSVARANPGPRKVAMNPELEAANKRTEHAIIEAEKFKAQINAPTGECVITMPRQECSNVNALNATGMDMNHYVVDNQLNCLTLEQQPLVKTPTIHESALHVTNEMGNVIKQ